jgi:hypothetical protein
MLKTGPDKYATLQYIQRHQKAWADAVGVGYLANGRVPALSDNLFAPLNAATVAEYEAADGGELGRGGVGGKMSSLHSSSALVCNVFDYWRGRQLEPLLAALGIPDSLNEIRFEQRFPTGLRGNPPNLDLLLSGKGGGRVTAIESKFTEPYQSNDHKGFAESYFRSAELWAGLERCRGLAEAGNMQRNCQRLDAAQLLKHILGLRRAFGTGFVLCYLWYDVPGSTAAEQHRAEVATFTEAVRCEVEFRSLTYQELFKTFPPNVQESDYGKYLSARYFS